MEEEFIPYQQALDLKDLGFDENCLVTESKVGFSRNPSHNMEDLPIQGQPYYWKNSEIHSDNCTLPLYQQAFKWFREKYELASHIDLLDRTHLGDTYYFRLINFTDGINSGATYEEFKTYQDAQQACLEKLIKLIKN